MRVLALVALACSATSTSDRGGARAADSVGGQPAAPPASVYVEELTWPEVRDAIAGGKVNAIVYVGSTEQNGPHMVIGKHNFVAHAVAGRIARTLGTALVYPTLPFALTGDAEKRTGHMRFPGSVTLAPASFAAVVHDVAASAITAGFRNVFLMGDHGGGQEQLKTVAASLDAEWAPKGVHVFYVPDLYYKSHQEDSTYLAQHGIPVGTHAGAEDTSQLLYLEPDDAWVRRDKLAESARGPSSATGVNGDPSKATKEMGRIFIDNKVAAAVAQMRRQLAGER